MRYCKRPIVIEAILWEGGDYKHIERFCGMNWGRADAKDVAWLGPDDGEQIVVWNALESCWLPVPKGSWIIRGIRGELYPCAPDVFAETYVEVGP